MNDITITLVLIGAVIGIVGGRLFFVLFDIQQLNKQLNKHIEKQEIELERRKVTVGTSFITIASRSLSEIQVKNLDNQAKRNDKTS